MSATRPMTSQQLDFVLILRRATDQKGALCTALLAAYITMRRIAMALRYDHHTGVRTCKHRRAGRRSW